MALSRVIGALTFAEVSRHLGKDAILCLPMGAIEQHGPHLPLDTDVVIAEAVTRRLVERYGAEFDLWQLPAIPIGLSHEHDWAVGTLSLSIQTFTALMRDLGATIARAFPARRLMIVNGHGGNRGILQNLDYELERDFGFTVCVLHPLALSRVKVERGSPDIHAGMDETSLMLAVAPERVRKEFLGSQQSPPDARAIHDLILDFGVTWPWSSGDPRIARDGVMGDPGTASAEFGERIIESILTQTRPVFERLKAARGRP